MVEVDLTAVLFAASFIAFVLFMQLIFFGPVGKNIGKRETAIEADKQKTLDLIKQIEFQIAQFKEDPEIIAARREASELVSTAKQEASDSKQKIVAENATELKATRERQLLALEAERDQVIKNLEAPIKEVTRLMVSKLLGGLKEELKV